MAETPLSSKIIGIILILAGLVIVFLSVFNLFEGALIVFLIYGLPCLILGIILLFWKKEDEIEQRKDLVKGGKVKK